MLVNSSELIRQYLQLSKLNLLHTIFKDKDIRNFGSGNLGALNSKSEEFFMFRDMLRLILYSYFIIRNCIAFYKEKRIYNLLFLLFFSIELLKKLFLEKYLISTINTVVMVIEAAILIIGIALFCKNKFRVCNN
ncbi:hypothetical protein [Clostridium sp. LCP25S3_F10]|uniref:hypothetical protein n=1 Tax=Clostridium sp. LCP25S3_F10 TaxID=3438750 RepID=UPI003F9009A0